MGTNTDFTGAIRITPCVEEPLVGGGGLVVEAFAVADVVGGVADGLLGGGEVVQPIIGQCPELVE